MVQSFGYKPLQSETRFIVLDDKASEEVVITADRHIYYFRSNDDGELLEFRSM